MSETYDGQTINALEKWAWNYSKATRGLEYSGRHLGEAARARFFLTIREVVSSAGRPLTERQIVEALPEEFQRRLRFDAATGRQYPLSVEQMHRFGLAADLLPEEGPGPLALPPRIPRSQRGSAVRGVLF